MKACRYGLGLALLLGVAGLGCQKPQGVPATEVTPADEKAEHDHAGHDHAHVGPHGGDIVELGDENYHAELAHDVIGLVQSGVGYCSAPMTTWPSPSRSSKFSQSWKAQ